MQCFVSHTSEACMFLFVQVADISAVVSVQATVFKDQKPSIVYLLGNNVLCKALCKQANLFYCHKTNTLKFALDLRTLDSWDMMPNETCSQEHHLKMERRNQAYL